MNPPCAFYFTEIDIRMSMMDATGCPFPIAGKNPPFRQRVEQRAVEHGLGRELNQLHLAEPSAATWKRPTATRSIFRLRKLSGISGIG